MHDKAQWLDGPGRQGPMRRVVLGLPPRLSGPSQLDTHSTVLGLGTTQPHLARLTTEEATAPTVAHDGGGFFT